MSFADIINQASKQLEQSGNREGVKYPETKHKRLFFEKGQREILLQILPAATLISAFAEPVRKIFLSTKSSNGKDINANFTLDAEVNQGSLLEQKITEWSAKQMIPNGFGGQTSPRTVFLVNAVKVIPHPANPQQFVQERDQQGNLVVRVFEMPQSAYANFIRKLQDPLYNVSGSELSFMDPNKPAPVKVSKPAKGQMEYPVEVYTSIALPPLGQGWEHQLEDLKAHTVPTERLENGYDWVQAFVDMKEGRKPGGNSAEQSAPAPTANPYAAQQPMANPYAGQQPMVDPYAQQPQVNSGVNVAPQPNPYAAPQPNPYANVAPTQNPYGAPTPAQQPQVDPYATIPATPVTQPTPQVPEQQPMIQGNTGLQVDPLNIDSHMPTGMANGPAPTPQPEVAQTPPAQNTVPTHNIGTNDNGLMDIDSMLERELNGGN
jgi:hypothetical protein